MNDITVIYFTKGAVPTPEDKAAAKQLSGKVIFRNAAFAANPEDGIEKCQAVAGFAPKHYLERFPRADDQEPKIRPNAEQQHQKQLEAKLLKAGNTDWPTG